jgi:hypothetical protein
MVGQVANIVSTRLQKVNLLCMTLVAVWYTVSAMVTQFCIVVTCILNTKKNMLIKTS